MSCHLNIGQAQFFFQIFIDDGGIEPDSSSLNPNYSEGRFKFQSLQILILLHNLTVPPLINYIFHFVICHAHLFPSTVGY